MPIKTLDPRMINPAESFTNFNNTSINNLTSINIVANNVITPGGNTNLWSEIATVVQTNSASWEESADITNISTLLQANSAFWGTAYATTTALSSNLWNAAYTLIQNNSASWEESTDILPTITNYLSTNSVVASTLNVTNNLLSANTDLFNLFLTPTNTLTTSICAISGNGLTPFTMNFVNGLLTSITL